MKKILTTLILITLLAGCSSTAPESNRDAKEDTNPQGIEQTSTTSPITNN